MQIEAEGHRIYFRALNRYTVNDIEKTEELLFTIEQLEAATLDLKTICMRLPFALGMHQRSGTDRSNPPQLGSWRYKPSELKKRPYQFPPNLRLPSPPPKASWEKS